MKPAFLSTISLLALISAYTAHGHDTAATSSQSTGASTKVLVYSNTAYYRYPDIPAINRWLVLLGLEHGIEVDITEHAKDLLPNVLKKYDVLLVNNANQLGDLIAREQQEAVPARFAEGKGIVGVYAALVKQDGWPWLMELGGCDFNSDSDFLTAKVSIDPSAKDHPAVKGQPAEFWIEADWTNHTRAVTRQPGFQVLLLVDETTYEPVRDYFKTRSGKAMGADHPIAWTHEPRTGGRFFYTGSATICAL